jgi:hypothetical protein
MNRITGLIAVLFIFLSVHTSYSVSAPTDNAKGWWAGVAKVKITPGESLWMAGYASRQHASDGTLQDLWSKALAIEDTEGNRALLITNDLLEIPKYYSDNIINRIGKAYGLKKSQIILNCSHTHSGPVMWDSLGNWYPLDADMEKRVRAYSKSVENKIVELAGKALGSMVPVEIYAQNGIARFQVNRRNNKEPLSNLYTDMKGPNDYAVPVVKVTDRSGGLIAVAFGYACHSTVLDFYQYCGDYPGYAQAEIEKYYPGTTAMFFQGAGADQNPLPRRSVALAVQYGRTLAAAVDRVLSEKMRKLDPVLTTAYSEINLEFEGLPPSRDELVGLIQDSSSTLPYLKQTARTLIQRLDKGEVFGNSYPYPCQVWKLGNQAIMAMGGELVIEYAIDLKNLFGPDIFVLGYTTDVMAYIPTETILNEGGYEGTRSVFFTIPWNKNIQSAIIGEMSRLAKETGIQPVSEPMMAK